MTLCWHCREEFSTAKSAGAHAAKCSKRLLPDMRPHEELVFVASEFGLPVDAIKYTGGLGRRAGSGRVVTLARGTFFYRMWAVDAQPVAVAAAIGSHIRTVRFWYAAFRKGQAA